MDFKHAVDPERDRSHKGFYCFTRREHNKDFLVQHVIHRTTTANWFDLTST